MQNVFRNRAEAAMGQTRQRTCRVGTGGADLHAHGSDASVREKNYGQGDRREGLKKAA